MPVEDRLCITGIGVVSPIGIGKEEFLFSLRHGRSGIEEIKEFDTHFSHSKKGGVIRSFHPKDFIPAAKIRRLDRASQFAIAAAKLALADAKFVVTETNSSRLGLSLDPVSVASRVQRNSIEAKFERIPRFESHALPQHVPNAPSSYVSSNLESKALMRHCSILLHGRGGHFFCL